MGIFKKKTKEKPKLDCSERPIEWYSEPTHKEVYDYYVTQPKVESFVKYKDKFSRTSQNYIDLHTCFIQGGDSLRPWLDPLYYFNCLIANYKASFMICTVYMGAKKFDVHDAIALEPYRNMALYADLFATELLVLSSDEGGDCPPLKYPDIIKQSKNPILNYLLRLNNAWSALIAKYSKKWELHSYMESSKNVLKISFVMLGYLFESYFMDGRNESDSDWMYDESLYLLPGKDGANEYPEARSFQNVCAQVRKKVADPEHWDKVLNDLSSELEYMDSMCE